MKRFVALLLVLAVIFVCIGGWGYAVFTRPGPVPEQTLTDKSDVTVVQIRAGVGLRGIARELKSAGVISDADIFYFGVRLIAGGQTLKAGDYAIALHASMQDIAAQLAAGRSISYKITVAEGLTSDMAARLVEKNPVLRGPMPAVPPEGAILPETYLFQRGDTREDVVARMVKAQQETIDRLWEGRAKGLPFRTKEEAIIMASVVEKETALADERRRVAAVFINRLRQGMKLQSDPTIIYGITKGYPLGRGIRESEIHAATPYNTYAITGLPKGPICNPGKDTLAAVLNPAHSNDLYFVADGTGGHAFAATLEEQNRNVHRWRKIEKNKK